ncbi:MAG: J domain-containing protein [Oscillospiraceae bacterium]
MDAHKILGVSSTATPEEIKTAYRALAQKYNIDNYEAGPLRDDAKAKMDEVNAAFDELMGNLRTGAVNDYSQSSGNPSYSDIRDMINKGDVENALVKLNAMPSGSENAEWNFLVGSAYYYKGWLSDASRYFTEACRLEPNNREYRAAMNNMTNSQNGNMRGNPYGNTSYGPRAAGCSCCDICTTMACMDMCCNCGGGGC